MSETQSLPSTHWADRIAEELIQEHGEKRTLVCASGISPSGRVHIGNFREAITVDLVVRALREKGINVRCYHSWDDYDALRKVPKNLPNPDLIEQHLRKPLSRIPDPFNKEKSYATHFESIFEGELKTLGIFPEYIYQNVPYESGEYADGVLTALSQQTEIRKILNQFRTKPLPEDWSCVTIYCKQCDTDRTKLISQNGDIFEYECKECKKSLQLNIRTDGRVKLLWRVDWPMRWAKEGVDFEPSGKDHSNEGGSHDTASIIIRQVWKKEPPKHQQYDFVVAKGMGAKLSSSSGNLITLSEALEVYEPPIVRWMFAGRRPNVDFSIAFDLDVLKAYDDFDRCERIALKTEEAEDKRYFYERRIYQLSCVSFDLFNQYAEQPPSQFPFRHLCNLLQIHQGDAEKAKAHFAEDIKTEADELRYLSRARCAWNWITNHAPEAFRFHLRHLDNPPEKTSQPKAIQQLIQVLSERNSSDEESLAKEIFEVMKGHQLQPKIFFGEVYRILIDKNHGPKLASFIRAIGTERTTELLRKAL